MVGEPASGEFPFLGVSRLIKPDGGEVFLLGTSHCSQQSAEQASMLVRAVRPSAVVVELCPSRLGMLLPPRDEAAHPSLPHALPSASSVAGSLSSLASDWTEAISLQYSSIERLTDDGITGAEFRAAAEEAVVIGARLVLGDRDARLTQRRLRLLVPTSELLLSLIWEDPSWTRERAYTSMQIARELQATSTALARAVARADEEGHRECVVVAAALEKLANEALEAATPRYIVMKSATRKTYTKYL